MTERPSPDPIDLEIGLLLDGIYRRYGADFRQYSPASVRRRVILAASHFKVDNLALLRERVLVNAADYDSLVQYLTVPTSEMFRDPAYYRAVREQVIPLLRTYPSLKIWIAGCSTGEELYSMAILLHEEGLLAKTVIYATDINPRSLERAKAGIFPVDPIGRYTENYQRSGGKAAFSDYYRAAYGSVIFDAKLREGVTFADHSLATDSVFAEVHFISCRNVLIYFNRALQDRAFRLFSEALAYRGLLGLGAKETTRFSKWHTDFEEFAGSERIFRKRRDA